MPANNNNNGNNVNSRSDFAQNSNVSSRHQDLAANTNNSSNSEQYLNPNNFREVLGVNNPLPQQVNNSTNTQAAPQMPQIPVNQPTQRHFQSSPVQPNPPIQPPQRPAQNSQPTNNPSNNFAQNSVQQPTLNNQIPQQTNRTSQNQPDQNYLEQVKSTQIPQFKTSEFHEKKLFDQNEINDVKGNETLKLVIYVVPVIGIFILLLKTVMNKEVIWHVRQSIVTQGFWFLVLIVLRLIDLPIISDIGLTLWNLACYGMLLIGGIQAYNGTRFKIPVAYEIAKHFIDGKES